MGRSTSHLIIFLITLAGLMGFSWVNGAASVDYRELDFEIGRMKEGHVFSTPKIPRKQSIQIVIGQMERYAPPEIGIFGNHQIQYFSENAFSDTRFRGRKFFNYHYANIALPELSQLLKWAAMNDLLPSDLVIVQITTPNNDNGGKILTDTLLLPGDIRQGDLSYSINNDLIEYTIPYFIHSFRFEFSRRISWEGLASQILGGDQYQYVVRGKDYCFIGRDENSAEKGFYDLAREFSVEFLGGAMLNAIDRFSGQGAWSPCAKDRPLAGRFRDGSSPYPKNRKPVLNEQELDMESAYLNDGDEFEIARLMTEINEVVSGAGRKLVFLVPALYETERVSIANKIFDKALRIYGRDNVVDHRGLRLGAEYFFDYDHAHDKYFGIVAAELGGGAGLHQ